MVLLGVISIIATFPALFAITVLLERKGLGRMQNRYGPNRVGPFGIFQPIADGIKSLTKEDIVPLSADAVVHFLAPVLLVVVVFMGYAVLPIGRNMTLVNMDAGLLFFFAIGASSELSVFMAGWSSRNKYSLLGAMRAVAQMISYEVPLLMSSVAVVMMTGSLSLGKIVDAQNQYSYGLPHWYVFTPWGFAGFILFAIAATAETNRSPFDLPEGESELVAGYYGIFGLQIRTLLSWRVCGHDGHFRAGRHAVFRRLLGAASDSRIRPFVVLVLREDHACDVRVHLGARNAAPPAPGSVDELCLEICVAADAVESGGDGDMAIHGRGAAPLGGLLGDFAGGVYLHGTRGDETGTLRAEELPVCGVT